MKSELLTLKDMIESLMMYSLEHCLFPQNFGSKKIRTVDSGIIDDERKIIYIDKEQTQEETRKTLIHEFLHAKYFRLGKRDTEKKVDRETEIVYKKLYEK